MSTTLALNHAMPKERPIGKRALDAFDANFEESSFSEAINALDQACSPSYAPHEQHIRQLLYVAMYPHPKNTATSAPEPQSPDKLTKIDRQKMNHPTPNDSVAALGVLHKFTTINLPQNVLRGIASYADNEMGSADKLPDSNIASLALKFAHCKDCWAILKSGFMSLDAEESNLLASPKRKRRSGIKSYLLVPTSSTEEVLIDENSWPILDWLLCNFEKDERLTEQSTGVRYSPLLLLQIPFPRDKTAEAERKELSGLLDLILFAFKQSQMERKQLGGRLLNLLINLGSTIHVNPDTLVGSLRWRLGFNSADEELVDFVTISAALPPTIPALLFKVLLCRRRITSSKNDEDNKQRPKPLGRQLRPKPASQANLVSSTPTASNQPPKVRIARKPPIPSALEIKRLFDTVQETGAEEARTLSDATCTMLISYNLLQQMLKPDDKDSDWVTTKEELCNTLQAYKGIDPTVALEYRQCAILLDT